MPQDPHPGAARPCLQAELPLGSARMPRLQGLIPPRTEGPCFVVRKHAPEVSSLEDLAGQGVLSDAQAEALGHAVSRRRNVLVVGGPRTGKTTLLHALLREMGRPAPHERIVLVEDAESPDQA